MSKGPMEFQAIQSMSTLTNSNSDYIPTGTDTDEFNQWQRLNPNFSPDGIGEITPDDYALGGFEPADR